MKQKTQTTNEKIKFDLPLPTGGTVQTYAKMRTDYFFDADSELVEFCEITVEYASHKKTFENCYTQFAALGDIMDWLHEIKDVDVNSIKFLPETA